MGSEDVLLRRSGLACHHHRAGVQQSAQSGYPGGKKSVLAPVFTLKVSAAVQMEEFANARPQEFIGPSSQARPCARFAHRKNSCK